MRDPAVHPPCTLLRTLSEFEIFCNKIINLPPKCCQRSWISARQPATKFYMRILARENWKLDSQSNSLRAKGGLFCNLCWPHVNCKQEWYIKLFHHRCWRNIMPTVWPTNKKIKRRVGRHKLICLKKTFCPAFKNKNNADWFFQLQRCSAQGICSIGSNCKPRCLQRCTSTFTQQHLMLMPHSCGQEWSGSCDIPMHKHTHSIMG